MKTINLNARFIHTLVNFTIIFNLAFKRRILGFLQDKDLCILYKDTSHSCVYCVMMNESLINVFTSLNYKRILILALLRVPIH